jgi:Glutathione S-transferase, N-terminal domain
MKLFGSPSSPYVRKARVLLKEKSIDCEFVIEDPWPAESKIPSMNPLGKVPVLQIGPDNYLRKRCHRDLRRCNNRGFVQINQGENRETTVFR